MKKLIIVLVLLSTYFIGSGQIPSVMVGVPGFNPGNDSTRYIHYKFQYGSRMPRFWADSVMNPPPDTTFSKDGIARIGSVLYVGDGTRWYVSSGTTVIFNPTNTIDSVVITQNGICVWSLGISNCHDFTKYITDIRNNADYTRAQGYNSAGTQTGDSAILPHTVLEAGNGIFPSVRGTRPFDTLRLDATSGSSYGRLSGLEVSYDTLLIFDVTAGAIIVGNKVFTSPGGSVTLDPADDDEDRFDIIAVDTLGNIISITGTPSANPEIPFTLVDPSSQVYLTAVLVPAGATEIPSITRNVIYDENIEPWTKANPAGAFTINYNNTAFPKHLTKAGYLIGPWGSGSGGITFTSPVSLSTYDWSLVKFWIKPASAAQASNNFYIRLLNGYAPITPYVAIPVNRSDTNYQNITTAFASMGLSGNVFDKFQIVITGPALGVYLDQIELQGGITNGNPPLAPSLQQVTNVGNTTTRWMVASGVNIKNGDRVTFNTDSTGTYSTTGHAGVIAYDKATGNLYFQSSVASGAAGGSPSYSTSPLTIKGDGALYYGASYAANFFTGTPAYTLAIEATTGRMITIPNNAGGGSGVDSSAIHFPITSWDDTSVVFKNLLGDSVRVVFNGGGVGDGTGIFHAVGVGKLENLNDSTIKLSDSVWTNIYNRLSEKELALGNPSTNGYILSSTTGGVRSWITPGTGGLTPPNTIKKYVTGFNTFGSFPDSVWDAITLTTTGSSGPATFIGGVLNIPSYSGGGSYTFSTGLTNTSSTITNDLSTGKGTKQAVKGGASGGGGDTLLIQAGANGKGMTFISDAKYDEANSQLNLLTASPAYLKPRGLAFMDSTTGTKIATLQGLNTGTVSYALLGVNKSFTGGAWVDNGLGRVGGVLQVLDNTLNFTQYNTGTTATQRFQVIANGNAGFGDFATTGQPVSSNLHVVGPDANTFRIGHTLAAQYSYTMGRSAAGQGYLIIQPDGSNSTPGFQFVGGAVGVGAAAGTAITASSLFDVTTTTKGSIPAPIQTETQRNAISSPAAGLQDYNTTANTPNYYNGTNWVGGLVVSSAGTLTLKHGEDYIFSGSTATWTLPAVSASLLGRRNGIKIKNRGSGSITLNSNAGSTLYNTATQSTITIAAGAAVELLPDGTYFNILFNL